MAASPKLRPIKDIRFFERRAVTGTATRFEHLGVEYPLVEPCEGGIVGTRFALLLASCGFCTPGYNHVYVTLRPDQPLGVVEFGLPPLESWMIEVDVGLPITDWPRDDAGAQSAGLVRAAAQALIFLAGRQVFDSSAIQPCGDLLIRAGADVELPHIFKETGSYRIVVTFQARPLGVPSPVFVHYWNFRSGWAGWAKVLDLQDWEDVFPLISRATVSRGDIVLSPRPSLRVGRTAGKYKTPIRVPISLLTYGSRPV